MHTTQEWHRHTTLNVSQAHKSRVQATTQSARSAKAHDDSALTNFHATESLHTSLQDKVNNSHKLAERLASRAASLEYSIAETKQSLASVEAALRAKEPRLQLCVWRIAQRERRPLREQVRDSVEVALEAEKNAIVDSQRKLGDAISVTQAVAAALERKLDQVVEDLEHKRKALHADELCLRTTHRSLLERAQSAGAGHRGAHSPESASSRRTNRGAQQRVTDRNEEIRLQDAVRLDMSAVHQEQSAKALRDKNAKLITAIEGIVKAAGLKTGSALQERINEAQAARRRLEGTIRDIQSQINNTRNTMSETRMEIKQLQEPIAMCATCTSVRKGRPHREHIADPVSTKLQEHKLALLRTNEALRSHHESEKAVLQDLVDRVARLKEDLKDKTAALRIDVTCLTHDPVYTADPPLYSGLSSRTSTPSAATPPRGYGAFGNSHRRLSRPASCGAKSSMGSMQMPMTVR
mmetsp:Transcript_99568/g.257292  ORF Transcript_99568/g.257292 Transcript_99568/m.257292 type:complete len:466 (+) Transcript_99568:195-1592(+)